MPKLQHMREILSGPLTGSYLESKTNEGWKAVAVIWEREVPDDAPPLADIAQPVPYGLKIAEDCVALEQDMQEREALLAMLEMIVQDKPLRGNRRGAEPARLPHARQVQVDAGLGLRHASPADRSRPASLQHPGVGGPPGQAHECELSKLS